MLQRWRKCSNVFIVGHCSSECFHGVWMLSFKKKKKRETEGGIFRSQIWAASISSVILYGRALNWVEKMVGPDYSFKWTGPNSQLAWKALSGLGNGGKRRGSAAGRGSSATVRVTEGPTQWGGMHSGADGKYCCLNMQCRTRSTLGLLILECHFCASGQTH